MIMMYAYLCILVCMIMYAYTCAYVWCTYTYICVSCRPRTQEGPSCSLAFCLDVWWTVRFFGHAPEVWRKPSVALDVLWSYGKRFLSWFWFPGSRFLLGYFTSNVFEFWNLFRQFFDGHMEFQFCWTLEFALVLLVLTALLFRRFLYFFLFPVAFPGVPRGLRKFGGPKQTEK